VPAAIFDVKKLAGTKDTYRIRMGDIRVVYEIEWSVKEVRVLVIGQRESIYE
jgi:mRNA interferase RelE/StbE